MSNFEPSGFPSAAFGASRFINTLQISTSSLHLHQPRQHHTNLNIANTTTALSKSETMFLLLAASVASAFNKTAPLIIEIISFALATTKLLCIIGLLLSGPRIYLHRRKIIKARERRIEGIILRRQQVGAKPIDLERLRILIKDHEIRDRIAGSEDRARVASRAQGQEVEG
ncbi:hypothetical protein TI39_contig4111g00018 [Zymoseptoria brevis]|uniref:Uncharacterized protein n=1 Tax=Zymoseptoria brevis TaxID=1047168 RepID=A0A0F4GEU0_9PEZI|nr:hypothetical protein TI39_contig4111g00018 [Zymoseptoria brevis]